MNFRGIAPKLLLTQVRNTASWALEGRCDGEARSWRLRLLEGGSLDGAERAEGSRPAYLGLLLAAHFATVGTFVPTDVDSHIRHHEWRRAESVEALDALCAVLDAWWSWDADAVSARVVTVAGAGALSGHEGEALAVCAGALGRALALGATRSVDALVARIDASLARHAEAIERARALRDGEALCLRVCCTAAHNLGDLSRVVEEWPVRSPAADALRKRYARLGHEDPSRHGGHFVFAGHVNKASGMATENHRFLALRAPKGLRRARALLLPIGPWFDDWGAEVARNEALDESDRAEVVAALVETHLSDPTQQGCLRALAGIHHGTSGGLDALARGVPARLRKLLSGGAVREALGVDRARFAARMANRYRQALTVR